MARFDTITYLLRASAAVAALTAGAAHAQTAATNAGPADQTASATAAGSGGDIIVTAQRRQESIQSVPIAITAVTSQTLKDQNIRSVQDYFSLTPNVSFQSNGSRDRKDLVLRGISNQLNPYADVRQASYAFYIDEFNVAAGTSNPQIVDLDRIEILRGPQGTYFGRNSVGGAINVITKKPVDRFEGEVEGSYSSFDTKRVQGVLNVPIISGLLALRGSGQYEQSDGFIKNINPIGGGNNTKFYTGRIEARLTPAPNFTWDLTYSYSNEKDGMRDGVPTGFVTATWASVYYKSTPGLIGNPDGVGFYPGNDDRVNYNRPQQVGSKYQYVSTRAVWDLGPVSITGVGGHVTSTVFNYGDVDGGSHDYFYESFYLKRRSTSGELRVQSNGSHFLDWSAGVSGGRDTGGTLQSTFDGSESPLCPAATGGHCQGLEATGLTSNSATSYVAGFGQATANITSKLAFTAGLRYSWERNSNVSQTRSNALLTGVNDRAATFHDWSPKFTLTYKPQSDLMFYATISKGFKSGGTQTSNNVNLANSFKPETLWNYEAGTKFELFDKRLRIDIAGFYMDWRDVQETIKFQYINPTTGQLLSVSGIANAASARSYGAEASFDFAVTHEFKIGGQIGYDNAKYRNYTNALVDGAVLDASGKPLVGAPKWTLGAQGQYTYPLSSTADVFLRAEWNYRSSMLSSQYALRYYVYPFISPSYHNVNLRLGTDIGPVRAVVYVQNLFDAHYFANAYEKAFYSGVQVEPSYRTVGVTVGYKF
ncbi:TonB-dependent receptor [Sphingomonas nostoxanthinifaciens]|uniref:TonB-dependent receptor n=1 Tax=Sphingomonas nostoxanthinifaciens TaxID=2872652 RepID=UPI001CC1D78E|nr:TonB-dependent receptor [Sphingomonas nostoxanthinifaciens]UAK22919.1 TonB-dependent receptor [Sphingomonas nostoxanthinifaciens]